jgi:hypothetical protein
MQQIHITEYFGNIISIPPSPDRGNQLIFSSLPEASMRRIKTKGKESKYIFKLFQTEVKNLTRQ